MDAKCWKLPEQLIILIQTCKNAGSFYSLELMEKMLELSKILLDQRKLVLSFSGRTKLGFQQSRIRIMITFFLITHQLNSYCTQSLSSSVFQLKWEYIYFCFLFGCFFFIFVSGMCSKFEYNRLCRIGWMDGNRIYDIQFRWLPVTIRSC